MHVPGTRGGRWRRVPLILPLLAAVFAFYAVTLRQGQAWNDDAAQYILHARNIAEGRPYRDTGYIFNPDYPSLGPIAYPPGVPLLLAPIWKLRGLDLYPMKLLEVTAFVAGLVALYAFYRRRMGKPECLALAAIAGFNPQLWAQKECIGSDFVFLPFLFLALRAIDGTYEQARPQIWRQAVPIAFLLAAAASVRSIGLVLLPAWIAYDLLRRGRISRLAIAGCSLALAFWTAQSLLVHSAGGNLALFHIDAGTLIRNLQLYGREFGAYWKAAGSLPVYRGLYAATLLTAGWALFTRLRQPSCLRIAEIFLLCYGTALLFYLPNEVRFLDPLFPIYVALSVEACASLIRQAPARFRVSCAVVLLGAVGLGYAAQYSKMDLGPIQPGFMDADFQQVAGFIRSQTSESAVFLCRKPRALALLTGRRAATYAPVPGLGEFVRRLHPGYIVASGTSVDVFGGGAEYLNPFLAAHADNLEVAYRNSEFTVYRVLRR